MRHKEHIARTKDTGDPSVLASFVDACEHRVCFACSFAGCIRRCSGYEHEVGVEINRIFVQFTVHRVNAPVWTHASTMAGPEEEEVERRDRKDIAG